MRLFRIPDAIRWPMHGYCLATMVLRIATKDGHFYFNLPLSKS